MAKTVYRFEATFENGNQMLGKAHKTPERCFEDLRVFQNKTRKFDGLVSMGVFKRRKDGEGEDAIS